jgi:hypothetical protein
VHKLHILVLAELHQLMKPKLLSDPHHLI